MENIDLVVIGAGPAGYPAALRAAQRGARTVIVEKEHPGGTCLNWGCIPTKTLIAATDRYAQALEATEFGITLGKPAFDYAVMTQRKDRIIAGLRKGIEGLLKANGIRHLSGTAQFRDRHHLAVTTPDGQQEILPASRIIIATGSTSARPRFLPDHARVLDSRAFLELKRLPASLIVLGGGIIGCEFACMAARLGVNVTIVELLDDILMILDPDVRRVVRGEMEKKFGIRILTGRALTDIGADDKAVTGRCGEDTLRAEALLSAVGRVPVTSELALDRAGLSVNAQGFIPVDAWGLTRAGSIAAAGDVNGGPQLAHAATSQGIRIAENWFGKSRTKIETLVPACIFTTPEVGAVGLTEQAATAQGRDVKCGRFPFAALGKAMALGDTTGFVKWIADAASGQLLGAQAVGPHATELIAEATVAIRAELTATEMAATMHAHPTLAEPWMEAAEALMGHCIHLPPQRVQR